MPFVGSPAWRCHFHVRNGFGRMIIPANPASLRSPALGALHVPSGLRSPLPLGGSMRISMRDRSLNRRPLQRGRDLSIEAIQAVQALKRVNGRGCHVSLERALDSKFRRLLKLDMIAVLRELLRQNECALSLKVRPRFSTLSS